MLPPGGVLLPPRCWEGKGVALELPTNGKGSRGEGDREASLWLRGPPLGVCMPAAFLGDASGFSSGDQRCENLLGGNGGGGVW